MNTVKQCLCITISHVENEEIEKGELWIGTYERWTKNDGGK